MYHAVMNDLASHSKLATVGRAGRKRINLVKLARAQRTLVLIVLVSLCLYAVRFAIAFAPPLGANGALVFLIVLLLAHLGVWIAAIVCTVRLSLAAGGNVVLAVIGGLLMLVPLLSLVLLLMVNLRATAILKRHGVKVGLLGAGPDEMRKLVEGACAGCGYSLEGLRSEVCPECGTAIA